MSEGKDLHGWRFSMVLYGPSVLHNYIIDADFCLPG